MTDVCEAVIGAALLSFSDTGDMDMAVKAVTALVANPDHDAKEWRDYYKLYKMRRRGGEGESSKAADSPRKELPTKTT